MYPIFLVHPGLNALELATEIAKQNFPLAGRLQHFISNWEKITQDQ